MEIKLKPITDKKIVEQKALSLSTIHSPKDEDYMSNFTTIQ